VPDAKSTPAPSSVRDIVPLRGKRCNVHNDMQFHNSQTGVTLQHCSEAVCSLHTVPLCAADTWKRSHLYNAHRVFFWL